MIRKLALALVVVILPVIGLAASPTTAAVNHHHTVQPHVAGSVSVNPAKATETTQGNVSLTIVGKGLIPTSKYKIVAATLTVNCKNTVNNKTVETDLKGTFNLSAKAGPNCVAETFTIQVQKTTSPFTVYAAPFQILVP
jgi:hypothetical protein